MVNIIFNFPRQPKVISNKQVSAPVVAIILLLGILCLGGAGYFAKEAKNLIANGLHAQGTVTHVDERYSQSSSRQGGAHMMYTPIVTFKDKQGRDIEFRSDVSSSSPSYMQGDVVEVIYLEAAPMKTAQIFSIFNVWLETGIFGVLALFLLLVGIGQARGLSKAKDNAL